MATIVVIEIQKELITPVFASEFNNIAKFYEVFDNRVIVIVLESRLQNLNIFDIISSENAVIEVYTLNTFARNRLVNNFEDARPELTLTIMGCSSNSKLIKIWKKNVKRRI